MVCTSIHIPCGPKGLPVQICFRGTLAERTCGSASLDLFAKCQIRRKKGMMAAFMFTEHHSWPVQIPKWGHERELSTSNKLEPFLIRTNCPYTPNPKLPFPLKTGFNNWIPPGSQVSWSWLATSIDSRPVHQPCCRRKLTFHWEE